MPQCLGKTSSGKRCRNQAVDASGYCRMHHPDQNQRTSTGGDFEKLVASALEVLGYKVERNVSVNGCQVDLYAEYHTGVIPIRLMVECKDYRNGKTVGNEEVRVFAATLMPARPRAVDKGLFVTTHGFTADAKVYAESQGIQLATYTELTTKLVDFDRYTRTVISDFEGIPSSRYYIPLSGTEGEDYQTADPATFVRPLEQLVNRILFDEDCQGVALLGNFGTGKTTFCRKFAADLARNFDPNDPNTRVPVVISLGEFGSPPNIQQLITHSLQFTYKMRGIDPALCMQIQEMGRFVLLFDGFDEMAAKADPHVIRENAQEISRVMKVAANKVILTCRTHFFRDSVQTQVLTSFRPIYIPEWGEDELAEYLSKRFGPEYSGYLQKIHGTHNLTELAQTPLFVDMIASTLPRLGNEVSRFELYDAYTKEWIRQQSGRRGARLDATERTDLMDRLAVNLYTEGRQTCHYRELTPLLRQGLIEDHAIDYIQTDVRTCTFLTRNTEGEYGFKHKSFLEFFVAKSIATEIREGKNDLLRARPLPSEVRGFVVEAPGIQASSRILVQWLDSEHQVLRDNALALVSDLSVDVNELVGTSHTAILIAKFRKGDVRAIDQLMASHWDSLKSFCLQILARGPVGGTTVDELVTETVLLVLLATLESA